MIFMLVIANDTGRWLKLAVMNAWFLAAAFQDSDPETAPSSLTNQVFGVVCLVVLLAMGTTTVNPVSRVSQHVAEKLGMKDPGAPGEWLGICDPAWRQLIAPPPVPSRPFVDQG